MWHSQEKEQSGMQRAMAMSHERKQAGNTTQNEKDRGLGFKARELHRGVIVPCYMDANRLN